MNEVTSHPVISEITTRLDSLTPKAQALGHYIMQNPSKVVFMRTKELAATCGVSEATVVRFVASIGYRGYSEFQQALKDFVNTGILDIQTSGQLATDHSVRIEGIGDVRIEHGTHRPGLTG